MKKFISKIFGRREDEMSKYINIFNTSSLKPKRKFNPEIIEPLVIKDNLYSKDELFKKLKGDVFIQMKNDNILNLLDEETMDSEILKMIENLDKRIK
jgi:hypothetical protein